MRKNKLLALSSLLLSSVPALATAAPAPVLVCYTAGPIDTAAAQEAMGSIMKVVERLGELPAGSFSTNFVASMSECYKSLEAVKPHYIFPSSELYLTKQVELGLNPLVKPYIPGTPADNYYVMVRKGSFKNLDELKGKKLGGAVLGEPSFLKRVVFENKIDPSSYFQLLDTPRPVKARRDLTKGKLDAVMVNAQQYNAMKELPFFGDLEIAYKSKDIMQFGLVSSKYADAATGAKVKSALEKLCSDAEGQGLCKVFGVENFVSTSRSEYSSLEQIYAAGN